MNKYKLLQSLTPVMFGKLPKGLTLALLCAVVLGSCRVTKDYQKPGVPYEQLFRDQQIGDSSSLADYPFDEVFSDTLLQALVLEGIDNSPSIKVALARIDQAEQYYKQSGAAFLPGFNSNLSVTKSKLPFVQGFGILEEITQYQANITMSRWELDVWGKLRSNRRASQAEFLASQSAAKAVHVNLVGTVANNYFRLLALDKQVIITEQTVRNWDATVETLRALKESGLVTEAAVVQSEAQRYAAEVTIPDLRQRIRETEHFISISIGRPPGPIVRGELEDIIMINELQTGLPIQLLANRPDVQQAEQEYRRAFELANVARTSFYPSIGITGSAGLLSRSIENFFDPSSIAASIGAGLFQPIFNQRQLKTDFEVSKTQQEIALVDFKNSLLIAGQEVSDAISLHEQALEKIAIREKQIDALEKSVDYTQELLQNGFANYNEVITARLSLLSAELGSVNDKLQLMQARINLYRSLGGGVQ